MRQRRPAPTAAAVFTSNRVQAAPVLWSRQVVTDGVVRAVVLNSGGANACTGPGRLPDTHRTAEQVAGLPAASAADRRRRLLDRSDRDGRLPMDTSCSPASTRRSTTLAADGGPDAAEAIMTTDTVRQAGRRRAVRDGWTVGGMAKGAGMLAPGLATMLVVLTTDAVVRPPSLDDRAARRPPGSASTGSTPTAACRPTTRCCCWRAGRRGVTPTRRSFTAARDRRSCADLALQLVADAEGAEPRHRDRRRRRRDRGRRGRGRRAASPGTTSSSAPCSATTPTGAGCWPPSAPPPPPSTRRARRLHQRRPGLPGRSASASRREPWST